MLTISFDKNAIPEDRLAYLREEHQDLYNRYSYFLYYSMLCRGGFSAIDNFAKPDYVQAYHDRCRYGAITQEYSSIREKVQGRPHAFHPGDQCVDIQRRSLVAYGSTDPLTPSDLGIPYWVYRLRNNIGDTLEVVRKYAPERYKELSSADVHYFLSVQDKLAGGDSIRTDPLARIEHTAQCLVSTNGGMLIDVKTHAIKSWSRAAPKHMQSLIYVTPQGRIEYYYQEDPDLGLDVKISGMPELEALMGRDSTSAIVAFWHILYTILREDGSLFDFVQHLSSEQVGHLMYESMLAAQSPVPGIKAPQDGSLTDLIHTIASRVDLIPIAKETWSS